MFVRSETGAICAKPAATSAAQFSWGTSKSYVTGDKVECSGLWLAMCMVKIPFTWYVTFETERRGVLPRRQPSRETRTFETEAEAKNFARARVNEGLASCVCGHH
jgi:hypothetical protein